MCAHFSVSIPLYPYTSQMFASYQLAIHKAQTVIGPQQGDPLMTQYAFFTSAERTSLED